MHEWYVGNCQDRIKTLHSRVDAILTDPPYGIGLHGKAWDKTDIAFSSQFWTSVLEVVKPGGFCAVFAIPRLYHKVATALEDAGLFLYPPLIWRYKGGLPKPMNMSKEIDRRSGIERTPIGTKSGRGFTRANYVHGRHDRTIWEWTIYAPTRPEAKQWEGYYYGVNTLKPSYEMLVFGHKPRDGGAVQNLLQHGTGGLRINREQGWPEGIFEIPKANRAERRGCPHPTIKPVGLLTAVINLMCPQNGTVLDLFAGSGSLAEASELTGRSRIRIEQDARMVEFVQKRVPSVTIFD